MPPFASEAHFQAAAESPSCGDGPHSQSAHLETGCDQGALVFAGEARKEAVCYTAALPLKQIGSGLFSATKRPKSDHCSLEFMTTPSERRLISAVDQNHDKQHSSCQSRAPGFLIYSRLLEHFPAQAGLVFRDSSASAPFPLPVEFVHLRGRIH